MNEREFLPDLKKKNLHTTVNKDKQESAIKFRMIRRKEILKRDSYHKIPQCVSKPYFFNDKHGYFHCLEGQSPKQSRKSALKK